MSNLFIRIIAGFLRYPQRIFEYIYFDAENDGKEGYLYSLVTTSIIQD